MISIHKHPLEIAGEKFGNESSLAKELGVTRSAFNQWKKPGRHVPSRHCPKIERLTGTLCEELNSEVDWAFIRGTKRKPRINAPTHNPKGVTHA